MVWNDDRVEQLKKLWADGLSASQIAAQLGEVTRNAVIGKVHRLGLATRASSNRTNSSRLRLRQAQPRRQVQRQRVSHVGNTAFRQMLEADHSHTGHIPVVEEIDIPEAERKTLQQLTECMCRWPIGDPQMADFYFCGRDKVAGLPYCEGHARRAYQPPQPRRRDRDVSVPALPASVTTPKEPVGT
ncbi:MAG: GcrA family cell cycle regulator [Hyphomicrobiaceae bacterium]